MSFETIASRLTGYVTKLPKGEAYNLANDAWTDIRNDRIWSFQLGEDGILTPSQITAGTVTTTLGSPTVTLDATANAALNNLANPLITLRQFRVQGYSIYSIVGYSNAAATLTLDRNYSDPSGASLPYQVYQAYFAAPVQDFKRWLDWRDMFNGEWLSIYATRRSLNMYDPQRLYYSFPHFVLPYQQDNRPGTSTPGWQLSELYPNPLSSISYMRWWLRTGVDLVNPGDTVPFPITDKLVLARARILAYQWAEGNKDPSLARGAGTDYKFLTTAAVSEYERELKLLGKKDRDLVDMYISRVPKDAGRKRPYYSSIIGRAYSGA